MLLIQLICTKVCILTPLSIVAQQRLQVHNHPQSTRYQQSSSQIQHFDWSFKSQQIPLWTKRMETLVILICICIIQLAVCCQKPPGSVYKRLNRHWGCIPPRLYSQHSQPGATHTDWAPLTLVEERVILMFEFCSMDQSVLRDIFEQWYVSLSIFDFLLIFHRKNQFWKLFIRKAGVYRVYQKKVYALGWLWNRGMRPIL